MMAFFLLKLVVSSFLVSKKSIIESLEFVDPPVSICRPSFTDATIG
jgi:hypothetical protein